METKRFNWRETPARNEIGCRETWQRRERGKATRKRGYDDDGEVTSRLTPSTSANQQSENWVGGLRQLRVPAEAETMTSR